MSRRSSENTNSRKDCESRSDAKKSARGAANPIAMGRGGAPGGPTNTCGGAKGYDEQKPDGQCDRNSAADTASPAGLNLGRLGKVILVW